MMKAHIFRELVNDLRDIAKQFHSHDSLRDKITARAAQAPMNRAARRAAEKKAKR